MSLGLATKGILGGSGEVQNVTTTTRVEGLAVTVEGTTYVVTIAPYCMDKNMATANTISFFRGDSHSVEVTAKKKNPLNPNQLIPVDLTGTTSILTVKLDSGQTNVVVQKLGTLRNPPGTNGIITFDFSPANTAPLLPRSYVYDVEVSFPGGNVLTFLKGAFVLKEDVTNSYLPPPVPLPGTVVRSKAFSLPAPAASDVAGVHVGTAANSLSNDLLPVIAPAYARTLDVTFPFGWDGGNVTIPGTNQFDEPIVETYTAAPGTTVLGLRAFKTVGTPTKDAVGASAALVTIGVGNSLAIYGRLADTVSGLFFANNFAEGATLNSTYNTVTPVTTLPDGAASYLLIANVVID